VLLQTILPEFEVQGTGDSLPNQNGGPQPDGSCQNITSISKRVLPALRQYSTWLVSLAPIIIATVDKEPIGQYIQDMWRTYARVLTGLTQAFPVGELPVLDYLLEEDKITVGFKPFCDPDIPPKCNLFTGEDGQLKPRSTRQEVPQDVSNFEMKGRIRDIILCALVIREKQNCPIYFDAHTFKFTFIEDALQRTSSGYIETVTSGKTTPKRAKGKYKAPESVAVANKDNKCAKSVAASDSHVSMDSNMHRMVDSLLEPSPERRPASNETSYGMHTHTANEIFASLSSTSYQLPTINSRAVLPSLSPGIWGPPLPLQPNELAHNNAMCPSTARNLSPVQLATREQQATAAAALDDKTGHGNAQGRSWAGSNPRPLTNPGAQSSSQQFMSMPSSEFSSSSSIYANSSPYGGRVSSGRAAARAPFVVTNGNNTTESGAFDFNTNAMLQSSLWRSEPAYGYTPPAGQGG
jgi:hypothetical protein